MHLVHFLCSASQNFRHGISSANAALEGGLVRKSKAVVGCVSVLRVASYARTLLALCMQHIGSQSASPEKLLNGLAEVLQSSTSITYWLATLNVVDSRHTFSSDSRLKGRRRAETRSSVACPQHFGEAVELRIFRGERKLFREYRYRRSYAFSL